MKKPRRLDAKAGESRPFWSHSLYLLFILLLAQTLFFFSPFFEARLLVIEGCSQTSPEEIRALTHFQAGHHMLALRLPAARQRILGLRWVKDVVLVRKWPHRVVVQVTERVPALRVTSGGSPDWYLADDQGRVLIKAAPGEGAALPPLLVDAPLVEGKELGAKRAGAVLECWPYFGAALARTISFVTVEPTGEVTLICSGPGAGLRIFLGDTTRMREKMRALGLILEQLDREGAVVDYIDLRIPERPSAMPRGGAPVTP